MAKFVDNRSAMVGTRQAAPATDASGNLLLSTEQASTPAITGPRALPAPKGSALSTDVKPVKPEVGTRQAAQPGPAAPGEAPRMVQFGDGSSAPVDIANNLKKSFQGKVYDPQTPTGRISKAVSNRLQAELNDAIAAALGDKKGAMLRELNSRWQNHAILEDMLRENFLDATVKHANKPSAVREVVKKAAIAGGLVAGGIEAKRQIIGR